MNFTPGERPLVESDAETASAWLHQFVPRRFLGGAHIQTVVGHFLPRRSSLPPPEKLYIEVDASTASKVMCDCHWQPEEIRNKRLTVVLLHGLEGSSNSHYVVGNADRAWAAGCNVVRMNMRNCGGTDHLSPTLYHSALSGDVAAVVEYVVKHYALEAVALVGYSMGGNLVLKLAGEFGHSIPQIKGVVGVCPAMDLAASSAAMHQSANLVYEWRFLRALTKRFRHKVHLFPEIYSPARVEGIRSLWDFDNCITAYYSGFESAEDYYYRASSTRVADRIVVPTLVLHAKDDPFIRMLPETRAVLRDNPNVTFIETEHGGHCAFLASAEGYDGYWAEKTLLGFLMKTCQLDSQGL